MPLMQNAPFEYGCSGLGATLVTTRMAASLARKSPLAISDRARGHEAALRLSALLTVSSAPQCAEHSAQVVGMVWGSDIRVAYSSTPLPPTCARVSRAVGTFPHKGGRRRAVVHGHFRSLKVQ